MNGRTSGELSIVCGVPQGSILGHLLFVLEKIYIDNDVIHSKVFYTGVVQLS